MTRLLLLLVAGLALASGVRAQTCTTSWQNPVDGDWGDAARWTNGVPIASSDACIVAPGTYTVTIRPDYVPNVNLQTLRVGGASGTQTLVSGGYLILTDLTVGARGRMEIIPRTVVASFSGLDASGSVFVEGFLSMSYNRIFLTNRGTLEVAPGGTLRGTNEARLGGANGTFTIRGTVELADGGSIFARAEVLGGTVRATGGTGVLFNAGGILRDATLDAALSATLTLTGNYALEGALSGAPQGEVYFFRGTMTAAPSGATLGVAGTGLRYGLASGANFQSILTGGPVLNTGRFVFAASNFFASINGTTLTNEGALDAEGDMRLGDGAVVRNRPGGVLRMVGSQIVKGVGSSDVRLVNEGLIVLPDVAPQTPFSRFLNVTLESLPGSELRVLDDYLDLASGPNTEALPPGMTLTGDGVVIFGGLPVRSTFSPGTEANPIGSLGPRTFDTFVLAPEAITILDIAAGGVSDRLLDNLGRGASVTLGGTLRVRARPGFTPAIGDSWVIAVNGPNPVLGSFSSIVSEGVPAGISFVVDTSQDGAAVLRAVALVSAGNNGQFVLEGQTGAFVLSHPASPESFTINVEIGGTATPFLDYSLSATRGIIRTRPNSTGTLVPVFMRTDPDGSEGEETVTLRVVPGLDAAPGNQSETLLRIQDGPPSSQLLVNGINPAFGANFGLVTAIVYGTAFSNDLDIRLVGPATIVGTAIAAFPQAGGVRVTFDLRDQPPGLYDVVLTGAGVATLVEGFGVIAPGFEFPIWSAVNGTPAPRLGRRSTYTVTIGNDGYTDVYDIYITIRINGAGEIIIEQTSVLEGTEDDPEGVEIEGQDVVPIYIYKLPARGNVQFTVRATGAASGVPLGVSTQLHRPNSKASFTISGDFADLEADSGGGLPTYWGIMSGYMNRFLNGGVSPEVADAGTGAGGDPVCVPAPSDLDDAELFADPTAEAAGRALGARAFTPGSDILVQPDGAAGVSAHEMIHSAMQIGRDINPQASTQEVEAAARRTVRNMIHETTNRRGQGDLGFAPVASATTLPGSQFGITTSCAGGTVGASGDPNDKLGPFGVGDARYVRTSRADVPYTIRFENIPTASFPAQEVVVVDTLDTAVFDLSTFGFGPISWGENRRLTPPPGAKSFEAEIDLSPEIPARLLVTAALDEASGRAVWHFTTLDPATNDLPEDGTIGFLPPNTASPNGEGALQFTVKTREGLPTGTEIRNLAEIVFDVNAPILTPVWTNTVDDTAPASRVQPLAGTTNNPLVLTISGTDAGSGVSAYIVYASQDGGAFQAVGQTEDGTFAFEGVDGSTYGFYSIAYDGVDNLEGPKTQAEATTRVVVSGEDGPDLPTVLTLDAPRPNPARGLMRLRYGLPDAGEARIRVLDALGREVAVLADGEAAAGWHTAEWTPRVASGLYVVEVRAGDAVRHQRLTVIR